MLKESPTFSTIPTPSSYPASRKRYLQGSRSDVRLPYREITLSDTRHGDQTEANPPVQVYDTSGPYTEADVQIDLSRGLPDLRTDWIAQRGDTEILAAPTSEYARERDRDLLTYDLRFPLGPISRRARSGENLSQMHYARQGIITPEMEFVALRESMLLEQLLEDPVYAFRLRQHQAQPFGTQLPKHVTPEFVRAEVAAGRAIIPANVNHPELEPMIIGRNFKVKINANIGNSAVTSSTAEEVDKIFQVRENRATVLFISNVQSFAIRGPRDVAHQVIEFRWDHLFRVPLQGENLDGAPADCCSPPLACRR